MKAGALTGNSAGISVVTGGWGEHPIADTPLHSLFSSYETQDILPGPKPKPGQGITVGGRRGLKPKRS